MHLNRPWEILFTGVTAPPIYLVLCVYMLNAFHALCHINCTRNLKSCFSSIIFVLFFFFQINKQKLSTAQFCKTKRRKDSFFEYTLSASCRNVWSIQLANQLRTWKVGFLKDCLPGVYWIYMNENIYIHSSFNFIFCTERWLCSVYWHRCWRYKSKQQGCFLFLPSQNLPYKGNSLTQLWMYFYVFEI